jgi:hypothetical protein
MGWRQYSGGQAKSNRARPARKRRAGDMVWPSSPRKLAADRKETENMRSAMPAGLLITLITVWLCAVPALAEDDDAQPDPEARISQPAEMKQLLTNQTLYGRYSFGGKAWAEYQAADGRTAYKEENCIYAGHWWIQDDLVCYRYEAFQNGKPACFGLFLRDNQLTFYMPGMNGTWFLNAYTIDRRAGNPDRMPVEGEPCVGA